MRITYLLILLAMLTGCNSGEEAMALYRSGMKEFNSRNLAGAEKFFTSALEKDSSLLNAHLMLCKIYYYNGNYKSAVESADTILDSDPDNANTLYWKARSLVMSGADSSIPVGLLVRSLEIDGHNIQARLLLGMIYEKNVRYKEALNQYLSVIEEEEGIMSARGNIAMLYMRMGFKEKCASELETAVKIAGLSGKGLKRIELIREEAGKIQ